jgi:hypothetical protein
MTQPLSRTERFDKPRVVMLIGGRECLAGAFALATVMSWTASRCIDLGYAPATGAAADADGAAGLRALARAVVMNDIAALENGTRRSPCPSTLTSLAAFVSGAGTIEAATASLSRLWLDRGAFQSWLMLEPLALLHDGEEAKPAFPAPITPERCDVHPCAAVSYVAFGEVWMPDRVHARLALRTFVRNIFDDHAERRTAVLSPPALRRVLEMLDEYAKSEADFEAARVIIEKATFSRTLECYSVIGGFHLSGADFATPLWLDPINGKFLRVVTDLRSSRTTRRRRSSASARFGSRRAAC